MFNFLKIFFSELIVVTNSLYTVFLTTRLSTTLLSLLKSRLLAKSDASIHTAFLHQISIHKYNHGKIISRLLNILAQFSLTTSERKLGYYHQKTDIQVAPKTAE